MGRKRAEDAAVAILKLGARSTCNSKPISGLRAAHVTRALCLGASATPSRPRHHHGLIWDSRRTYATGAKEQKIAVLGGGLTGLTTAYYLAKQLPPTAKITLYESSDRLGGWIKTDKVSVDVGGVKGNVTFERGPRTLSSLHQSTWRYDDLVLYDLALDLGLKISSPPDEARFVYYPDHLVALPPTPVQLITEPLFLQSFFAGLSFMVKRYFKSPLGDNSAVPEDISIGEWLHKISGSYSIVDNFASAMIHGIYGGDVYKLSAKSVLEQFFWWYYLPPAGPTHRYMTEPEKNLMMSLGKDPQIRKMALNAKGSLLHFGEGGMETLPKALAHALESQPNVDVRLNEPVRSIEHKTGSKTAEITTWKQENSPKSYDKVISTLTTQDLHRIVGKTLPTLAETHVVSIMTVNLWFPEKDLKPPGFGYLIPRSVTEEQNPFRALGVFFDSDVGVKGPNEPEGTKLFVLMGGHYYEDGPPPPTEEEAIKQARALLELHLGISKDAPCFAMASMAKECIPQHFVGHSSRMTSLSKELQQKFGGSLAVTGGSYSKVGAMGAIRNGYDIAAKMVGEPGWLGTGLEKFGESSTLIAGVPVSEIGVRKFRTK